jgi:hypothetical protein
MLPGLLALLFPLFATAAGAPCFDELPLLKTGVAESRLSGLETVALRARIPHRADDPTWLSTAEALLIFRRDLHTFRWNAHLKLQFPSDAPYGIPFTFLGARIRIEEPPLEATLDWSSGCTEVGYSLFPRQSFETPLPETFAPTRKLRGIELLLWGSRN